MGFRKSRQRGGQLSVGPEKKTPTWPNLAALALVETLVEEKKRGVEKLRTGFAKQNFITLEKQWGGCLV